MRAVIHAAQPAPRGCAAPIVAAALRLRPAALRVDVVLADDATLRDLNRRFRRRDRATDVLTFRYEASLARSRPRGGADPDGEIYVSLDRAARQARERDRTLAQEVVLLVLHGLLHLQGHDHHAPAERDRMHAAEVLALRRLGPRWPRLGPMVAPARWRKGVR